MLPSFAFVLKDPFSTLLLLLLFLLLLLMMMLLILGHKTCTYIWEILGMRFRRTVISNETPLEQFMKWLLMQGLYLHHPRWYFSLFQKLSLCRPVGFLPSSASHSLNITLSLFYAISPYLLYEFVYIKNVHWHVLALFYLVCISSFYVFFSFSLSFSLYLD